MQIPVHFEQGTDEPREQEEVKEQQTTADAKAGSCDKEEPSREETAYLRLRADLENLKKRQAKEIKKGVERELTVFLRKFLTISDDLEGQCLSAKPPVSIRTTTSSSKESALFTSESMTC